MRRFALAAALHLLVSVTVPGSVVSARPSAGRAGATAAGFKAPAPAPQSGEQRAAARVDGRQLLQDVRALSAPELEGRLTGTAGSRRAQALILARFKELKLDPVGGTREQKFSFVEARGSKREFPDATNLMGMIRGSSAPDEFVLVTAHYDHLGVRDGQIHHGADDNASGVAAMLAIARWFAANPPAKSVAFVAFDGEEQGLQGARHFVAKPAIDLSRISAVINMDMVGRGDKNVIYVAGTHHHPVLKPAVDGAVKGRGLTVRFGHDRPGVPGMDDWTQSSDHGPFHAAGIPFLYFGVEDHSDYHKPTDTADKIPGAFYREATELVLDTVRRITEMTLPKRAAA